MSEIRHYEVQSLWKLYTSLLQPLSNVIARAECRGIRVDLDKTYEMEKRVQHKLQILEQKFFDTYGFLKYNSSDDCERFFVNTLHLEPVQTTQKGKASMGKYTLNHYAAQGIAAAKDVIELKRLHKLLNTFIRKYIINGNINSIVYINYNLTGTVTGRLSSSALEEDDTKFNAQNLTNDLVCQDGEVFSLRSLIVPREGYKFVHKDAAQSELRILAWFTNDDFLVNACKNDLDLHSANAEIIFNVPMQTIIEERKKGNKYYDGLRRDVKNIGFAYVYDAKDKKINMMCGGKYTEDQLREMRHNYFSRMKNVPIWKNTVYKKALANGNTVFSAYGGRRVLQDLLPPNEVIKLEHRSKYMDDKEAYKTLAQHEAALREGINCIIQRTSVEYLNYGFVETFTTQELDQSKIFPLLQTHDSTDDEVEEDYCEEYAKKVKVIMEKPKLPIDIPMKFQIDIKESLQG